VFVSNSERLQLKELADVLGKELPLVMQAMSNAVRMGFAVLAEGLRPRLDNVNDMIVTHALQSHLHDASSQSGHSSHSR
jgi:hypothetical protein